MANKSVNFMFLGSVYFQVSFLFPTVQSTITALFVGMYDISSIVPQLVKVLYLS